MGDELTQEEIRRRLDTDPDFVNLPKFDYSLRKVLERYDEVPEHLIARGLCMTVEEVQATTQRVLVSFRERLGVDETD